MTTTHADAMHRDITAKDAWDAFGLGGLLLEDGGTGPEHGSSPVSVKSPKLTPAWCGTYVSGMVPRYGAMPRQPIALRHESIARLHDPYGIFPPLQKPSAAASLEPSTGAPPSSSLVSGSAATRRRQPPRDRRHGRRRANLQGSRTLPALLPAQRRPVDDLDELRREAEQRALQLAALSPPGKPSKDQFRNSIRGDIITAVSFPDRLQQDR